MASSLLDVCRFNPTLGGTTDWTFSSAVTGYQSPALAGIVNGQTYTYRAENTALSEWEIGTGTYNTGTGVLTRAAVLYNSSGTGTGVGQSGAGTKISFSSVPQVAIVAIAEDLTSSSVYKSFVSGGAVGDGTTDDTTAIQALINANPSNAVLDGQGKTYKVTTAITIPASSTYLKIQNAKFSVTGDINFLSVASGSATFFEMDTVTINAPGQTTLGRVCVDVSRMMFGTFRKVWINATVNKSYAWYGQGTAGTSPYYCHWQGCYAGNFNIGIMLQDAAGSALGPNSNMITDCRFQPQTGNFGVYLGAFSQNINVIGCHFESTGGTGIYMDGIGHLVEGCRFESQTTGVSVQSNCTKSKIGLNYYDSNATHVAFAGSSRSFNIIEFDPVNTNNFSVPGGIRSTHATGAIGYGTGAGGTVTQATSKSTTVTLNTACGAITMNAAALAAGGVVSFLHLCSAAPATTDILSFNYSGATAGAYNITAANVGGAFSITVRNLTAGSLSEAIVIQYAVLKTVNS